VEIEKERWSEPQTKAEKYPSKAQQGGRRSGIEELAVERQEAAAEKTGEGQAQEKEDALEAALAAMAEDHYHPEKRQQRSSSENDEAQIEEPRHEGIERESTAGGRAGQ